MSDWDEIDWDPDPVASAAAARLAYLRRQANLGKGWHAGRWEDPAGLLRQLADQAEDPVQARSRAYVAERVRLCELGTADEVRDADQALAWLTAHTTVQEGP